MQHTVREAALRLRVGSLHEGHHLQQHEEDQRPQVQFEGSTSNWVDTLCKKPHYGCVRVPFTRATCGIRKDARINQV